MTPEWTIHQITPVEWGARLNYDDPDAWNAPSPPRSHDWWIIHWGGGPNPGGSPDFEPELTLTERIRAHVGVCASVLRGWEAYHLSKGWRGIAYNYAVDPVFGRLFRLRGWHQNGGQYGHWNAESLAVVFVLGYGQYPSRRAWRTFGCLWVEHPAPVIPHRWTNVDTPAEYQTSCPGDEISAAVYRQEWIRRLGTLRLRRLRVRGQRVRSLTARLAALGYLDRVYPKYARLVADAVRVFQQDRGLPSTGVVDAATWQALG